MSAYTLWLGSVRLGGARLALGSVRLGSRSVRFGSRSVRFGSVRFGSARARFGSVRFGSAPRISREDTIRNRKEISYDLLKYDDTFP